MFRLKRQHCTTVRAAGRHVRRKAKIVTPVAHDHRLLVQAALAIVYVGRLIYQPSRQRSGYVLFASEAAGANIGEAHTVRANSNASYMVCPTDLAFADSSVAFRASVFKSKCKLFGLL